MFEVIIIALIMNFGFMIANGAGWLSGTILLALFGALFLWWPTPKRRVYRPREGRVFKRKLRDWTFTVRDDLGLETISRKSFPTQQGARTAMKAFCSEPRDVNEPV